MRPINASINDTSRILGVGRTKVYGLIAQGKLKSVLIGRRRLVLIESICSVGEGGAA